MPSTRSSSGPDLARAVSRLEKAVESADKRFAASRTWTSIMTYSLVRGMFYGLGMLLAFALLIPIVVSLMSRAGWLPIVGQFFIQASERIEDARYPTLLESVENKENNFSKD